MIYINPIRIIISHAWETHARDLTTELLGKNAADRKDFIKAKRDETWGDPALLASLRGVVGNKCWYSEVPLEGADPNVDHFRPKGQVSEIDNDTFEKTGVQSQGYWWLAFEPKNYRLSSMHTNQRRIDETTEGGKWDFFPVEGPRSPELTEWALINENVLPFDPCSFSDMALMWFDPDGNPGYSEWRRRPTTHETRRMKTTIWLYHLDKKEIVTRRASYVEEIRTDLNNADVNYKLWNPNGPTPDLISKGRFDAEIAKIKRKIADDAAFAGAKRCAVQIAKARYPWIDEFNVI